MKALIRSEIGWISHLTAVRLELAALLSFEKGGDVYSRCFTWRDVPHVGMRTYTAHLI